MTHQLEAVYEDGVLRLLTALDGLEEHTRVRVTVEPVDFDGHIADCAGTLPDEAADEMNLIITEEFGRIDPDER